MKQNDKKQESEAQQDPNLPSVEQQKTSTAGSGLELEEWVKDSKEEEADRAGSADTIGNP